MIRSTASQDAAWLDRMYNNRKLVPDHAAYFERWAGASKSVRQHASCHLDIAYGLQKSETLDVFTAGGPPSPGGAPVLVFVHGGYWRSLDKSDHSFLAPAFTQAGACVVVPNYALCPAVSIPDIALQMVSALAWTWRHVAEYGGDPHRITVVGHSAGGHLTAMLLTCCWEAFAADLPPDLVDRALSISGLYDLEPLSRTPFLSESLRLTPAQVASASPALLPCPAGRTFHSVAGGDESAEFLRQNQLIRKAWGQKTVPVCEVLPGLNHFSVLEALVLPTHRLHRLTLDLLGLQRPLPTAP